MLRMQQQNPKVGNNSENFALLIRNVCFISCFISNRNLTWRPQLTSATVSFQTFRLRLDAA